MRSGFRNLRFLSFNLRNIQTSMYVDQAKSQEIAFSPDPSIDRVRHWVPRILEFHKPSPLQV